MKRRALIPLVLVLLAAVAIAFQLSRNTPVEPRSEPATPASTAVPITPDPAAPSAPPYPEGEEPTDDHGDPYATDHLDGHDDEDHQSGSAAAAVWTPVVEGFARDYTRTDDRPAKVWRSSLDPYTVAAVDDQLATVDPRNVPAGDYQSHEVLQHGAVEMAVLVTYRQGWSMVLWLIDDGTGLGWQVEAYDRYEE